MPNQKCISTEASTVWLRARPRIPSPLRSLAMAVLLVSATAAAQPRAGACLPIAACAIACPFGMAHGVDGCPRCACNPDPRIGPPAPSPIQPFVAPIGHWDWFNRVVVSVRPDSSVSGTNGERGVWRVLDPVRRIFVIEWNAGWVDTLTISPDGNSLDGGNQNGTHVFAQRRIRPIQVAQAVAPFEESLGTFEGVHPHWRDRVFILRNGTYHRSNGDGGRFTFDGQKLTLYWDRWGSVSLDLREPGYFVDATNTFSLRKIAPLR